MFCEKCGAEIPDDSKHCKECGAKITTKPSTEIPAQKKRKDFQFQGLSNTDFFIWCGVGLFALFLIMGAVSFSHDNSGNNGKDNSNNSSDIKKSDSNQDKKSDTTQNKEMNEEEYKSNCTTLEYNVLQKNPSKHFGEKLSYTGKVFQISEDRSGGFLLLAVNDDSNQL